MKKSGTRAKPSDKKAPVRKPGAWRGKVKIKRGFDQLPESIAAAFRGERD
jgi:hypothetical protein